MVITREKTREYGLRLSHWAITEIMMMMMCVGEGGAEVEV